MSRPTYLDALNGRGIVGSTEHAASRHNRVGTSLDHHPGILRGDTAVNLNPRVDTPGIAHGLQHPRLLDLARDELLSAESGVDTHQQHQVDVLKHVLNRGQRRGRVEHDTSLAAEVLDLVHASMQVGGRALLGVDRDDIRASLGKVRNALLRLDNHQMAIQRLVGDGAERVHNQRSNRDVRDKATVHHVDVHPVAPGLVDGLDLRGRTGSRGSK